MDGNGFFLIQMPSERGGCCAHGASWEQGNAVLGQPLAVGSPDEPIPLQLPQVLRPVKYKQFKLNFKKRHFSLSVDIS